MSFKVNTNDALLRKLDRCLYSLRRPRLLRWLRSPARLLSFKILYEASERFNVPLQGHARTFWGDTMSVVVHGPTGPDIYKYGLLEEGLTRFMLAHVQHGMTVFDVGAHFGYFTMLASHIVGDEGCVCAFEPTPNTFEILCKNIKNKHNVRAEPLAVWRAQTTVTLNDFGFKGSAFNSLFASRLDDDIKRKFTLAQNLVQAISLDDYTRREGLAPQFVKIDAELAEHEIVRGMEHTIAAHHPIISLEVGDVNTANEPIRRSAGADSASLVADLLQCGYRAFAFNGSEIVPDVMRRDYAPGNVFFVPG